MPTPTLFLDLDGVAHPADVYVTPKGIILATLGHELFEHLPLLAEAFVAAPRLQVVLSTQWAAVVGYRAILLKLPVALRKRVVGATTFGVDPRVWRKQTRHDQISTGQCQVPIARGWRRRSPCSRSEKTSPYRAPSAFSLSEEAVCCCKAAWSNDLSCGGRRNFAPAQIHFATWVRHRARSTAQPACNRCPSHRACHIVPLHTRSDDGWDDG